MSDSREREQGIALIVAILALLILSLLGLALATTTSTEVQIATNYRWGQQAYYNAEAGIEFAKYQLNTFGNFGAFLNPPNAAPNWTLRGSRNNENAGCDPAGVGYGLVFDVQTEPAPF